MFYLKTVDHVRKPRKPEPGKPAARQPAQVAHASIRIVSDDKADKPVQNTENLSGKLISTTNVEGSSTEEGYGAPAAIEEGEDGAVIEPQKGAAAPETDPLTCKAEVMPQFPGGVEAFKKFMLRNLRQPDDLEEGEKVVVLVKFIVETDGSIVNAEILQGGRYDEDVLKVVKKMPRWKPGMQGGRYVPVYFTLPVTFVASAQ